MFAMCVVLWFMTIGETEFGYAIGTWVDNNAEWVVGLTFGAIVGSTSAIAQPWLMKQHKGLKLKLWQTFTKLLIIIMRLFLC